MRLVNSEGRTILNFQAPLWRFLGKVATAALFIATLTLFYIVGFIVSGV